MTDVLILHRIPGAKPGDIRPLDDRMQRHVDAGNAEILPNENPIWEDDKPGSDAAPQHVLYGTGNADDLNDAELEAATAPDDYDEAEG